MSTESEDKATKETAAEAPTESSAAPEPTVELPFQAEVQKVLQLVIDSLYTHREVFLRELISNASDALDKARFLGLTRDDVTHPEGEACIDIRLDDDARTLTIEDNGIGMTREEVIHNLGTIARSGSLEFLKQNREAQKGDKGDSPDLIGQFGVGFYATFMVASRVDVKTRSMLPGAEPVVWRSTGTGSFTVLPGEREHPGTEIVLHLREEHREFAKAWRVRDIIKKYSDFVSFPIKVGGEVANQSRALWTLPKAQVTDEQHAELFHHLTGGVDGDAPLTSIHYSIDAPVQFHALLYIPSKAPFDLFQRDRRGLRLYAKRVLIMEDCDKLSPIYLRFLRGVVDSEDLSLNVSREMLQENRTVSQIEQQLVKQVLKSLKEMSESEPDKYKVFWTHFGKVLKEGISVDWKHKDAIADLCRFEALSTGPGELLSLRQYVDAMPAEQKEIYFITGPTRAAVAQSPHLEGFRKKGYDVLLLSDPIDEWVVQGLVEYDKRKLKSAVHGEVDLGEEDADKGEDPTAALEAIKGALGDKVKEVRWTRRLTDSASCLVSAEGDPGANFERIMKLMDESAREAKRILELNPKHPIVQNLDALVQADPSSDKIPLFAQLLYDQALLAEGVVEEPAELVKRMQRLMTEASAPQTKG
jgi:molecular chaperone HtpG